MGGYGVTPMTPDQLNIDPSLYPYMQEVLDERLATQVPNVSPSDIAFWDLPEFIRQMYYQGTQSRIGAPAGAVSEYANRIRMRGLPGGSLALAV